MEPILLITNSLAGAPDERSVERALRVLRAATDVEVAHTTNPGELDGVLHRRGGRQIVVAGGDGSLHAVMAALHRRHELVDAVVGLVPLGTDNDFARGVGLPLDPAAAARVVLHGSLHPVDLIVDVLGEVVVNRVHVGSVGHLLDGVKAATRSPILRLRIEVDGQVVADFAHPVLMVTIGNGSRVAGGARLTHQTQQTHQTHGRMDVEVSFATSLLARAGYAARFALGSHHEREDVLRLRAQTVTLAGQEFYCRADGELYGPERNRTWHVEPRAFSMPLPR